MRGETTFRSSAQCDQVWWSSRFAIAGLMLLSTVPLWFVSLPPLTDLLGHMGRYHIQLNLNHAPLLQKNWEFGWQIVGNLGVDLLIYPFVTLFGIERAVWLIAMLLPPLMIWGIARTSLALYGRISPFALAAIPFAMAYPYQLGFVNYWLACSLALHGFASWVRADVDSWSLPRRALIFGPAAIFIWLAHVYGWAIFLVLVVSYELSRRWTGKVSEWASMTLQIAIWVWPVIVPLLLMIIWRQNGEGAGTTGFFLFFSKFRSLLNTLRDQNFFLDMFSLLLSCLLIYVSFRVKAVRIHPALGVAVAMFMLLELILPVTLFGSTRADSRLWPILFITALTAACPRDSSWKPAALIAGLAIVLFTVRIAFMASGFMRHDQEYATHLRALDYVSEGASIAVLTSKPCTRGPIDWTNWRHTRLEHLGSIAIVRKQAFVNSQWNIPGAQLLTPLGGRGTAYNADPSQFVLHRPGCSIPVESLLEEKIHEIPKDRFDYVWLIHFDVANLPAYPGLTRVYADKKSALYRLS
jgi:hypothetical protein